MRTLLESTGDPAELIDGDPIAAERVASDLQARATTLDSLADSLSGIDPTTVWQSEAGEAIRPTMVTLAQQLSDAAAAHQRASAALSSYADSVRSARVMASRAVETWQFAQQATTRATAEHQKLVCTAQTQAVSLGITPAVPLFVDPGETYRTEAIAQLTAARQADSDAGDEAADTVQSAANQAPDGPSFWDRVGGAWSNVWHGAQSAGDDVANAIASFATAMGHHPDQTGEMLAGLLTIGGGLVMEATGTALDLTFIGLPEGVALNVTGAGVVASGASLSAIAALRLGTEAAGEDSVHPYESSSGNSGYRSPEAEPESPPTYCTGYTDHSLQQSVERVYPRGTIEDIVDNPDNPPVWQQKQQTWLYARGRLRVAVNEFGKIVTVFKKG